MKHLGPVAIYAHLQASGIVNDHQKDCYRYGWLVGQYPVEYMDEASLSDGT